MSGENTLQIQGFLRLKQIKSHSELTADNHGLAQLYDTSNDAQAGNSSHLIVAFPALDRRPKSAADC
jgi:hypothetical protein